MDNVCRWLSSRSDVPILVIRARGGDEVDRRARRMRVAGAEILTPKECFATVRSVGFRLETIA